MDPVLQDVCAEAMRALFVVSLPCVLCLALTGLLSGIFQTATSIHEQAISYTLKIFALFALATIFFVPGREALVDLFMHAFRG